MRALMRSSGLRMVHFVVLFAAVGGCFHTLYDCGRAIHNGDNRADADFYSRTRQTVAPGRAGSGNDQFRLRQFLQDFGEQFDRNVVLLRDLFGIGGASGFDARQVGKRHQSVIGFLADA